MDNVLTLTLSQIIQTVSRTQAIFSNQGKPGNIVSVIVSDPALLADLSIGDDYSIVLNKVEKQESQPVPAANL